MQHLKQIFIALIIVSALLLLAIIPLQQIAAPAVLVTNMAAPPPNEVRALWVVREAMTSPDEVSKMVKRAKEAGFNTLIVQVRGRGDAYYNARWEPRASSLESESTDFDPLAQTITEAHAAGLTVHAWINTFLVADAAILPKSPDHAMYKHPEWLAVPRGIATELYRGDPKSQTYSNTLIGYAQNNKEELEGIFFSPAHRSAAISRSYAAHWQV